MGANFRPTERQTLAKDLIFAVVICRLALDEAHSSMEPTEETNWTSNPSSSSSGDQQTACDSLFIANEKLAKYCLCRDQQLPFESSLDRPAKPRPDLRGPPVQRISQLSCQPNDLPSMREDLSLVLMGATNKGTSSPGFQIGYLNISTNITRSASNKTIVDHPRHRFQIDHVSLQLVLTMDWPVDELPSVDRAADIAASGKRPASRPESQMTTIQSQMIDFCGLINETRLQFLSISMVSQYDEFAGGWIHEADNDAEANMNKIHLASLLAKFSSLTRLELNFDTRGQDGSLTLDRDTLRQQSHLKWLNLASNKRLLTVNNRQEVLKNDQSPFAWSTQLEYLSLESCDLERFPLFSLFPIQFKLASSAAPSKSSNESSPKVAFRTVFGLPNLTTLNLASNMLKSLEQDLFGPSKATTICQDPSAQEWPAAKVFLLPSLTQLDLSENQLDSMTFRAGQYILCTMPNLNQLFLRRNNIKHLNLNSLLVFPTIIPGLVDEYNPSVKPSLGHLERSSRLEYLDLSQNDLLQLSALTYDDHLRAKQLDTSGTRIKYINLSQNKLTKMITLINSTLIDRLIFHESFDYAGDGTELRLDRLDQSFKLADEDGVHLSICDFLSPRTVRKLSKLDSVEESLVNEIILNNNRLTKLTGDDFYGRQCADIQILTLSSNRIQSISDQTFKSLIRLEQLDLESNALTELEKNTFEGTNRLRMLNLARNKIKILDRELFSNMSELEELFLNSNGLIDIPGGLFAQTSRLSVLDLSHNRLTNLEDAIFSDLSQLRVLNLKANLLKIENYLSLFFKHTDNGIVKTVNMALPVRRSSMSRKQKQSINSQLESSRKSKTRLNRDISEDANNILSLTGNQIESFSHADQSIPDHTCTNLTFSVNVQVLWLNDNKLRQLSRSSFRCFESIQRLHLQSNQIRSVDDLTFTTLAHLEFVDLSNNQLTSSFDPFTIFAHQTSLSHIDVSSNRLVGLNLSTNIEMRLEVFDASKNPDLSIDSTELVEFMSKFASLRSINFSQIKQISSRSADDKQTEYQAIKRRYDLDSVDLSGSFMDSGSIRFIYHYLSSNQNALMALAMGNRQLAFETSTIQMPLRELISARLELELEHLDLSGSELKSEQLRSLMSKTKTEAPFPLKYLNLSSNVIDSWPIVDRVANRMTNLKSLDMSKNKIRYLMSKNDSFTCYSLRQLEHLNLSSNAMISLINAAQPPTRDLHKVSLGKLMPSLKSIDLSHNRLSWIPTQFFEALDELSSLRLEHNQIETYPSNLLLTRSKGLVHLDLDHNKNMKFLQVTSGEDDESRANDQHIDRWSNLILFSGSSDQIRCLPIEEFINEATNRPVKAIDGSYLHLVARDNADNREENEPYNEQCQSLISLTRSISLNSIGLNASTNLDASYWLHDDIIKLNNRPILYDLSFRFNELRSIEAKGAGSRRIVDGVVKLDLGENRINELPGSSVCLWPNLMTLNLSGNKILELSLDWIPNCSKLTYVDLSRNQINSIRKDQQHAGKYGSRGSSRLLALVLRENNLSSLDGFPSSLLSSLKLIDLRMNPLISPQKASLELRRPLLTTIWPDYIRLIPSDGDRPLIRIDASSMRFSWNQATKNPFDSYSLSPISNQTADSFSELTINHSIKFCRLGSKNLTRVCLQRKQSDDRVDSKECLLIKVPQNTLPCLTDLQQAQASETRYTPGLNSSHNDQASKVVSTSNTRSKPEEDVVLNFIDSMKKNWLKLREVDINEYLADNLRAGYIWVQLGERYQINSLTVVKMAIIVGSICIIGLLLAIFTLLTYFSQPKISLDDSESESASELTTVTNPDSTLISSSSSSSTLMANKLSTNNNSSGSINPDPRTRTSLQLSEEESRHLHELAATEITKRSSEEDHLFRQPQICVTPSSSLAPSSIETAETMQAVDSIQSGTPNMTAHGLASSVDQYLADTIQQDLCQQQVATVTRMVKSNSANFDQMSNRKQQRTLPQVNEGQYGTMNARQQHNYSTLRARIRHHNNQDSSEIPFQQIQIHDRTNTSYEQNSYYHHNHNHGTDPATMSLLSLSSALSTSTSNSNFPHPGGTVSGPVESNQTSDILHSNLCHYHSRMMQQPAVFVNQNIVPSAMSLQPEVIPEQEEDQSSFDPDSSLPVPIHNLPPPPPPPRTMEALEYYDVNSIYKRNH